MENNLLSTLLPTADQGHAVFNSASSHIISGQFLHHDTICHNTHEQIMASGSSSPSHVQHELLNNLYMPNNCSMANSGSYFAEGCSGNIDMATSLSAASLANLLPTDCCSGQGMYINDSTASALASNMISADRCSSFNSYPVSRNHDYGIQDGLGHDESLKVISTVHPSYQVTSSAWPGWNLYNSSLKFARSDNHLLPRNELSLSLGSCQPPIISLPDFPDHCSEKSSSIVTQVTPNDSEELSLFCCPSSSVHFSHVLLGSRYLDVGQKVLAALVNYALGDSEEMDDSVNGIEGEAMASFSTSCFRAKGLSDVTSDEFTSSSDIKFLKTIDQLMLEHKTHETKLVAMLQMVDHIYNQCRDHIQNVITTFHNATNSSSPQMLAQFAIQTVTSAFKNLRERITREILLATSQEGSTIFMRGKEKATESSFTEKQCDLQLGRKDQPCWRPQRGLPEKSVSVLKAWMFQNFLHPYPKDNDKHLLAMQSGLTRSQVSNWFINARVRLWKPMIEEMYSEIRKRQTEEGSDGDTGFHGIISNQRPSMD